MPLNVPDNSEPNSLAIRLKSKPERAALEAAGWRAWYTEIYGAPFVAALAPHHAEATEWHWTAKMRQRVGLPVDEDAYFAIWSRGHMKSTVARRIAVADAALSSPGYCLYTAGTVGKISGHAKSIETLLTSTSIKAWYPGLARVRKGGAGYSKGWTNDFLYTDHGYIFHFVSLDQGIRGANVDDVRPTLIVPDDIDEPNDSPAVSAKRFRTFTRSVLPTRQSGTLVFFAQNLIAKHSVMNKLVTGKERALTRRKLTAPIPALLGLETEFRMVGGVGRDLITAGAPTWNFYDSARCQEEIDTIGLPAFLAECQHDLTGDEAGRVLPEYNESLHVITWSQFERVYGARHIPAHWQAAIGHDIGYTAGHLSAVSWVATSAANSKLPNKRLRYRGLTFLDKSPDEMAEAIIAAMRPDPATNRFYDERTIVKKWLMSHEKKGERKTYREKYQLPFIPCDSAKTAGIPQWRHYLRADRTRPHPFHADTQLANGTWLLGEPGWFDVVDDDQLAAARDDRGLKLHREQALVWLYAPERLTDKGLTPEKPVKAFEDTCLVEGTMVRTAKGDVPIERVKVGDLIWTRKGLRRCTESGMTNPSADVMTLELEDGRTLTGTGNHPVYVDFQGFVPLDSMRMCYTVNLWQSTRLSTTTERAFTVILKLRSRLSATTSNLTSATLKGASSLFTSRFGSRLTATCRRVARYITETATRLITPSPTWNVSRATYSVSIVPLRSKAEGRARGSAQRAVSNASKTDALTFVRIGLVATVLNLLKYLPARAVSTVPRGVRTVYTHPIKMRVFNLSVDGAQEYFANGILVHNCDATRMVTATWGAAETSKTKEERIEDEIAPSMQLTTIEQLPPEAQAQAHLTRSWALERIKAREREAEAPRTSRFVNRHSLTGRKR